MQALYYRRSARRDVGMDGACSAFAPWFPNTRCWRCLPASQPASQPVPPFRDEPLAEAARMNKKERSRVLRAVWAVRSTSWASWAVPSGRGRCRSKRAGQILPVFVIAAPCWPSCPGARAAPDERERVRLRFSSVLSVSYSYSYSISRPIQRDRRGSERRSPRTKRFSIHPQALRSTRRHAVRCNGPGLV